MGQLSSAGVEGEARNFLSRGLIKTWFQAIDGSLWPLALAVQPAAVGCACPCPRAEQVAVPSASGLFEASSAAVLWLPDRLQQGCSQAAHLTQLHPDPGFPESEDGPGQLGGGGKGRDCPSGGGGCWGGADAQPLPYPTVRFCCFRLFMLKRTIYTLAFLGKTPRPVGELCESLQPVLCCRMAAWVPTPQL